MIEIHTVQYLHSIFVIVFVLSLVVVALLIMNAAVDWWIDYIYSIPAAKRRKIVKRIYWSIAGIFALLACFSAYMLWGEA